MGKSFSYGWVSDRNDESHAYLIPAVRKILKGRKVETVLDIGAGNGSALPFWMTPGIKLSAMEPDEQGYQFARERVSGADVRRLAVGEDMPAEWRNAFDVIICLEVIEHLFDPQQLIETIRFTLKKDGIAIISTPYHGYLKNLIMAIAGKWDFHHHPLKKGGHIKFWSLFTLCDLFRRNGFVRTLFLGLGRIPYVWKSMIIVFKRS